MTVPTTKLSQNERMQGVLRLLDTQDSISVAELSKTFRVSEVTVRNDLSALSDRGLVARVRGGVRSSQHERTEVAFDSRLRIEAASKQAIAKAAAGLVEEGEAVALDSSTTAYYLAVELRSKREVVVVTNGLFVAAALADAPGITVLMTGGMLHRPAMSLVGELGLEVLRTTRINKGFLGARGISLERGLADLNPGDVWIKHQMANACEQVYGILDGTKWRRSALLSFVPTDQVDGIVTDATAPAEDVRAWRERGVSVTTVEVDSRSETRVSSTPDLRQPATTDDHGLIVP